MRAESMFYFLFCLALSLSETLPDTLQVFSKYSFECWDDQMNSNLACSNMNLVCLVSLSSGLAARAPPPLHACQTPKLEGNQNLGFCNDCTPLSR